MPSSCWISLLLLLLPAVLQAQSGDGDTDTEPRISCSSHITPAGSNLTCTLVGGGTDDEDDEDDGTDVIERLTVCYTDPLTMKIHCVEGPGDTVSSSHLRPVLNFSVTAHLKRGGAVTTMINLQKIVKPRSPQVLNVTFNQESNQVVIRIQTPYRNEYLKVENQLFQLLIWNSGGKTVQNISSLEMKIDMEHIQKNTEYHVKVRSIPHGFLQGSWSDWSKTFTFCTPPGEEEVQNQADEKSETLTLVVGLVVSVALTFSVVFFWKNKIFMYMWPSIPHPKHTLLQICQPNKGLLLNLKPDVVSTLKVCLMEQPGLQPREETEPSIAADGSQSNHPGSTQSSDCCRSTTSVSTEELELSALLSRSSSDGEDGLRSTSPSPIDVLRLGEKPDASQPESSGGGHEVEPFAVNQQDEAYVTMSSFYQIK